MHPSRVLLADDHPSLAAAIGEYVAEAFQLVGTVRDGGALFEAAKTLKPDVIVADISMPGTDGLTAMKPDPEAPAARESDPADQLWGCRGGTPRT
jgi:CheY-like chemotaxis protein